MRTHISEQVRNAFDAKCGQEPWAIDHEPRCVLETINWLMDKSFDEQWETILENRSIWIHHREDGFDLDTWRQWCNLAVSFSHFLHIDTHTWTPMILSGPSAVGSYARCVHGLSLYVLLFYAKFCNSMWTQKPRCCSWSTWLIEWRVENEILWYQTHAAGPMPSSREQVANGSGPIQFKKYEYLE